MIKVYASPINLPDSAFTKLISQSYKSGAGCDSPRACNDMHYVRAHYPLYVVVQAEALPPKPRLRKAPAVSKVPVSIPTTVASTVESAVSGITPGTSPEFLP